MSALSDQVPTLVGVLIGAAAAGGFAMLADRLRWRREYDRRWDDRRLDAIAAYAAALKVEARACLRVSAATWPGTTTNPLSIDEGAPLIALAEDRRSEAFEPLQLLADADTVAAARVWQEAVWRLHVVTDPPADMDRSGFLRLFNESGEARYDFYGAARSSLEVSGERHRPTAWKGI